MAMTSLPTRVLPKFVLVSEYTVRRMGKFPSVTVRYTECSFLKSAPLAALAVEDLDQDGLFETITIADATSLGMGSLVGHIVSDLDDNALTTITATEQVVATPEERDENNVVTRAATYTTKITLAAGLTQAKIDAGFAVVDRMPVGTTAYMPTPGGRTWEITLYGNNALAMTEMGNLLGGAYFMASKALIAKLGVASTDAEILAAIQALAAEGTNIDGMLGQQGEALEGKRQANQLPFAQIMGDAPSMS